MHVLIIPSEHFVTEIAPLAGIFQYDQAIALSKATNRVGVISVGFHNFRNVLECYPYQREQNNGNLHILRRYQKSYLPQRFLGPKLVERRNIQLFLKVFALYLKRHGRPDIIHAHNVFYAGFIAKYLSDHYAIPYVLTEHSSAYARGFIPPELLVRAKSVCVSAKALSCVSHSFQSILKEQLGFSFEVLHNIVDGSFFDTQLKHPEGDDFVFLNVASLDENKNQALALRAFAKEFKGRRATFRIAGDGPLKETLKSLAAELGIASQIKFLGQIPREAVREEMRQADCFVLPSNFETFGVVLIEAMASGLPLVATRSGGPEDIVTAKNGILVGVGREDELAAAMVQIFISSSDAFPRATVREYAKSHFGEGSFVRDASAIYEKAVSGYRSSDKEACATKP